MEQLSHVKVLPRFLPVLVMLLFPPCVRILSPTLPEGSSADIGVGFVISKDCCGVPFTADAIRGL